MSPALQRNLLAETRKERLVGGTAFHCTNER
jgi:hypothetical protein